MCAASLPRSAPRKLGRYELIAPLATGGMAELYLGRLRARGGFEKLVAIKQMKAHLSDDPGFVAMFLDEGRIAARLTHPNICQVYELGDDDGQLYMAMEFVQGIPLSTILSSLPRTQDAFDVRVSAGILVQVSEGVHFAHEHKADGGEAAPIVHRDVSPTNLLVTGQGVCKLVDFGIAKVLTEVSHTRTGVLKGKPAYMAPEQIRAEPVDRRSDVFALGVVLWECIAGKRLFQGDSDFLIWQQITQNDVPKLRDLRPEIPAALDDVIQKSVAKDPAQRHETARAFAADLRRAVSTVGGPLEPAALAMYLSTLCADAFAARAELVAQALAGEEPEAEQAKRVTARNVAIMAGAGAEPTASIRVREHTAQIAAGGVAVALDDGDGDGDGDGNGGVGDETIEFVGTRRKWWPIAVGVMMAAAAGVVVALVIGQPATGNRRPATGNRQPATGNAKTETQTQTKRETGNGKTEATGNGQRQTQKVGEMEMEGETVAELEEVAPSVGSSSKKPKVVKPKVVTEEAAEAGPPGYYLVDSQPYARIFIDGKDQGETPLFRVPLAPGKHQVKAVLADGRKKQFAIHIKSGKDVSSGRLKW